MRGKILKVPSVGTFASSGLGFSWATELRLPAASKQLIVSSRISVFFIMFSFSIPLPLRRQKDHL